MAFRNKNFTRELTTGFGEKSTQSGGRYYRKDGKANVIRSGINFFDELSWYHTMLSIPRWKFWLWLLIPYIIVNLIFASLYYAIGIEHLDGIEKGSPFENFIEAFLGVFTLALAAGVFYGRFSKPRSFLKFSENAVIAPYKDGIAFMFRTAPYKNNHLMDAEVKLTIGMRLTINSEERNEFYPLPVEISKINALILNWTIVHPINENSPIYGMSLEELKHVSAEVLVYLKAYDEGFSNTVVARTSYTAHEIIEGAKFKAMYNPSTTGHATILHIDKLNDIEKVKLPELKVASP